MIRKKKKVWCGGDFIWGKGGSGWGLSGIDVVSMYAGAFLRVFWVLVPWGRWAGWGRMGLGCVVLWCAFVLWREVVGVSKPGGMGMEVMRRC